MSAPSADAQQEPEVEPIYGWSSFPVVNDGTDDLDRPNYVLLLWELTGVAAYAEKNPQADLRDFISFSRGQRDFIRNKLNELSRIDKEVQDQLFELSERSRSERDPAQLQVLSRMCELLEPERHSARRKIVAEISPELNSTQRRQLREYAIGIILLYNPLEAIFEGAHKNNGLNLTAAQLEDLQQQMRLEVARLMIDHGRKVREGWDRIMNHVPDHVNFDLDSIFGIDALSVKENR
ncbi:MAG TPA: hypothetical protein PKD54_07375 [Pirellulaceae bacterium]|nr:hypothetical protein [Pirellulaceae bacterium]